MTPAIYETMLLSFGGQARGVVVKGIDVGPEKKSDEALQKLSAGRLDFSPDAEGIDGMVVGKQLSEEWKMQPGDYVTLTSPQGRLTPFGLMPTNEAIPSDGHIRFWILRLRRKLVLHCVAGGAIVGGDGRRRERAGIPPGEAGAGA